MFDPADLDNYDHGPHDYDESEVARLEAEDELPAWRDSPTMPGLWLIVAPHTRRRLRLLTPRAVEHWHNKGRVFGPIPTDLKGT